MEPVGQRTEELIERLTSMRRKDRIAVLNRLSDEQRQRIENAMHAAAEMRAEEIERQKRIDRQYLGYSPWLASLIEAAETSCPAELTQSAADAMRELHSTSVATRKPAVRQGWLGIYDQLRDLLMPSSKVST